MIACLCCEARAISGVMRPCNHVLCLAVAHGPPFITARFLTLCPSGAGVRRASEAACAADEVRVGVLEGCATAHVHSQGDHGVRNVLWQVAADRRGVFVGSPLRTHNSDRQPLPHGQGGTWFPCDVGVRVVVLVAHTLVALPVPPQIRENLFEKVAQLYADMDGGLTPLTVFYPTFPTAAHKKRDAARDEMVRLLTPVIEKRRASGEKHDDCLQAFIECQYKDGSYLTDYSITGLMIALLFAGQHTSSITSTWTVLYILHNPDI